VLEELLKLLERWDYGLNLLLKAWRTGVRGRVSVMGVRVCACVRLSIEGEVEKFCFFFITSLC
jgi:hypothetical protein